MGSNAMRPAVRLAGRLARHIGCGHISLLHTLREGLLPMPITEAELEAARAADEARWAELDAAKARAANPKAVAAYGRGLAKARRAADKERRAAERERKAAAKAAASHDLELLDPSERTIALREGAPTRRSLDERGMRLDGHKFGRAKSRP